MFLGVVGSVLGMITVDEHDFPDLWFPRDVRTIRTHLDLDAIIIRTVCCPSCYCQYNPDDCPEVCTWKRGPKSRPCGEPLLKEVNYRVKGAQRVPRLQYSAQSFDSWLSYFLKRPGIEDHINQSYRSVNQDPPSLMRSIWDSPSWLWGFISEPGFSCRPGNLTFALYIDWFNPFGNSTAGKVFPFALHALLTLVPCQARLSQSAQSSCIA